MSRSTGESVFLAFDDHAKRLVELHVIHGDPGADAVRNRSSFERAVQASELRGGSFSRILEVGEDDGLVYYASTLNDGEFVEDYIARRGALPPATAFCLLLQLLEDLVQLQSYHRLISRLRLNRLLITALEDAFLHLRVCDYGLAEKEVRSDGDLSRLSGEVCELVFLLLTGRVFSGENPDRYPALTCLPTALRVTLRSVLADRSQAPATLEKLRDDVREAFAALVNNLQSRTTRKHLVVTSENLLPKSQLQELLLENAPVDVLLQGRFDTEKEDGALRYPFSIPARNGKTSQRLTVHLLPPARIVPKDQYEAVPLQMWRFDPQKHPNILRSLSLWESPDWTFLTEEREGGFALSRLIAERIALNPAEVLVLLRQVRDGIAQALECGVPRVDLHPSNMVLQMLKASPMPVREFERLMQKRVDVWPAFKVKLRPHMTMRSLYEPLLVDRAAEGENGDLDFRGGSFVALAAYMLTGERLAGRSFEFPETVPQPLARFVTEAMASARQPGGAPSPDEFLEGFEKLAAASDGEGGLSASFLRGPKVSLEQMESAGSISDFDDESFASAAAAYPAASVPVKAGSVPGGRFVPRGAGPAPKRRTNPLLIWGAAGVVIVVLLFGMLGRLLGRTGESARVKTESVASGAAAGGTDPVSAPQAQSSEQSSAARRIMFVIRKAIKPTQQEIEEYRREQQEEAAKAELGVGSKAEGKLADRSADR